MSDRPDGPEVRDEVDVIVVGAGPAGAVAAALLAQAGVEVALLERAPRPFQKICGEYLSPRAVEDLERLGFADALRGVPARRLDGMLMVAPDGSEVAADFAEAGGTARHGLAIAREQLDGALQREAVRRGAALHFGAAVNGVTLEREGVSVRMSQREWRARLLIGADGRFSIVAHALGLALPAPGQRRESARRQRRASARRGAIHAWLRGVSGLRDRGEMHLLRDGSYLGLDPLADGRLNAGLVVDADVVAQSVRAQDGAARLLAAAASSPALARRFAHATIDRGERAEAGDGVRYLAPMRTAVRAVVAERTLLVGDAAGFFDPLTGEGITLAIASAELAARAAIAALGVMAAPRTPARMRAALAAYARAHARLVRGKQVLHPLLQSLLRRPRLANFVGRRLQFAPAASQRLLAVIGNLRGPAALLHPAFWLPLLRSPRAPPAADRAPHDSQPRSDAPHAPHA